MSDAEVIYGTNISQAHSAAAQLGNFVAAIGVFDGLHLGHRFIIDETCAHAHALGAKAVAITFDHDPDEMFKPPEKIRKLVSNAGRIAMLAGTNLDVVLVLPFDDALAALSGECFLDDVLLANGNPKGIHVGSNFRFGQKADSDIGFLKSWGGEHGCEVFAHDLYFADGEAVSSTRIRNLLQAGELELANKMLGRPHFIEAEVVRGHGRGAKLGFSTANLQLDVKYVRPADGVYFAVANCDGKLYKAAVSVGVPSTFADGTPSIEAHLLDFEGDLYGKSLQLHFCEYLRAMQTFDSAEELTQAVTSNIETVQKRKIPKL